MNFRYANLEDLGEIVRIYNSTVPGRMVTADLETVTVEQRMDWFYAHSNDKRPLWVMEIEGQIAGWLSFQSFYGRPAYDGTVEVSIYLDENYRGRGFGEKLLQFAIENCQGYNIKVLLGFIFGHNIPSMKLFKKYGFGAWGNLERIAVLDSLERDLIIMGKRI
ncbi:MAG: N-acetyltransferase [Clostridiaceae bacterium]|nr:N-acetyltransferase [Clostridiaceae bacterium]